MVSCGVGLQAVVRAFSLFIAFLRQWSCIRQALIELGEVSVFGRLRYGPDWWAFVSWPRNLHSNFGIPSPWSRERPSSCMASGCSDGNLNYSPHSDCSPIAIRVSPCLYIHNITIKPLRESASSCIATTWWAPRDIGYRERDRSYRALITPSWGWIPNNHYSEYDVYFYWLKGLVIFWAFWVRVSIVGYALYMELYIY